MNDDDDDNCFYAAPCSRLAHQTMPTPIFTVILLIRGFRACVELVYVNRAGGGRVFTSLCVRLKLRRLGIIGSEIVFCFVCLRSIASRNVYFYPLN